MHSIQRKQFSETNVTGHTFQQISDLKNFPESVHGPHAARGPVAGPHCSGFCLISSSLFLITLCGGHKLSSQGNWECTLAFICFPYKTLKFVYKT